MSAAIAESTLAECETLADVIHALGDVPLHRILFHKLGTATEDDVLRYLSHEPKRLVELVDGVLVEKPMGQKEGYFAASLIAFLVVYVRPRRLGVVGAPDTLFRITPDKFRLPDVCYTAWENLPNATAHLERTGQFSPDLAVEILSSGNTRLEIEQKRREYFSAGTMLVWIFDPEAETVAVYTSADEFTLLKRTDTLDGGVLMPGFTLPLEDLFGDPQLNPRPEPSPGERGA